MGIKAQFEINNKFKSYSIKVQEQSFTWLKFDLTFKIPFLACPLRLLFLRCSAISPHHIKLAKGANISFCFVLPQSTRSFLAT